MNKKLSLILFLSYCSIAFSQKEGSFWNTNVKSNEIIAQENILDLPVKHIYGLNIESLKTVLINVPKRNNSSNGIIITLPNSEGNFEKFKVYENSNFAPALAARYPEIKSYIGIGIDNLSAKVYFSISPLGFKSMTVSADKSAEFIEPITTDLTIYSVYKKTDKKENLSKFECTVLDVAARAIDASALLRPNADDSMLRTFRLAMSCTGEYTAYFGGTKALALAAINNSINRVNGVFEMDFGVRMEIIANTDLVIYTNASSDPYSNSSNKSQWNAQLQSTLTSVIGESNYDVGHLFGATGGGGNAGCIGCVCVNGSKGSGITSPADGIPYGDNFDIDYVAHELGHQFGANHTWTHGGNEGTGAQMEPGSGSTIMGYAGITSLDVQPHSDAYFHAISIQQVTNNIKTKTCQTNIPTGNTVPTADAGLDYTIPKGTPFVLTGSGDDGNGDVLSYNWEQMDAQTNSTVPSVSKTSGVNFRSYNSTSTPERYFPKMSSVLTGATTTAGSELTVEAIPNVARTLNFRLTVRDNHLDGPANNSDDTVITVNATAGPFIVTSPNTVVSYPALSTQTITWDIAGTTTNGVNCANVDIFISTNGGTSWTLLLGATTNDGSANVTIPNNVGTTNRIMVKGTNHIFFDVSNTNFTITSSSSDSTPPSPPTLVASGTTITTTNLSWSGATDNIGVTGYDVYQDNVLIGSTTTATTFNVTGLSASTSYSFTVKAKDAANNFSPNSNTVTITTLADTVAPTAPVLSASGTSSTTTNLSWTTATDNVGVTGYDVYKGLTLLGSTTSATTFSVTGLTPSTNYSFIVKAKDEAGNMTSSNTVSITTLAFTYCASQGNSVADELIGRVQFGTIDNTSTGGTGYTDFTNFSTIITRGTNQTITITPTWTGTVYNEGYAVFIDYNGNGVFTDAGETVWTNVASKTTPVSGTFTIPVTATIGTTRMRVSMKYNGIPTSCETFSYGQVEDYTIIIEENTPAATIVNLKLFIEGFYDLSTHEMRPVLANQGIGISTTDVDDITVELVNSSNVVTATTTTTLKTDGTAIGTFPSSPNGMFYIVVKHRNAIETWSSGLVMVGSTPLNYDFTTMANKAYGDNMVEVETGKWAFYSGDINQDEVVDGSDSTDLINDIENYNFGLLTTDINGDGVVDGSDSTFLINNLENFIFSIHP